MEVHEDEIPVPSPSGARLLEYETPRLKEGTGDGFDVVMHGVRRLGFALGFGLLAYGIGLGWSGVHRNDAADFMGWGGFLTALTIPWRRRK